jgi:hypothetical protein
MSTFILGFIVGAVSVVCVLAYAVVHTERKGGQRP